MTNAMQANTYQGNYDGIDAKTLSRVMACPFCGTKPEVMPSGERGRGLMIHCIAENCPNPSASYYDHETALAVWNRRDGQLLGGGQ